MLKRYFHTIKVLRFKQIYYRLYYLLKKPSQTSHLSLPLRQWRTIWSLPLWISAHLSSSGDFSALGESGNIYQPSIWYSTQHSKLWLYHLHYFDVLNAINPDAQSVLLSSYIEKWIACNPPIQGSGWDPYPISLRIVNWIVWFSRMGMSPQASWLESLTLQAQVLMQRIEYHLLANHLFANGKALVFVGVYFTGKQADGWLKKGLKILDHEVKEQFLEDGGHFELSPMYHARMIADLCDLLHLANITKNSLLIQRCSQWKSLIQRGLAWLAAMVHPDGEIAFFNDAAMGMAPTLNDLRQYATHLGLFASYQTPPDFAVEHLQDTGYDVIYLPHQSKAILDVAHVGPDYQPGHAHADTLSFELSVFGQRWIVNSGTSCYGLSATRSFLRSTKAHNTICVNDQNSSDVWSGFRVGKRAYPKQYKKEQTADVIHISCAHNGYGSLTHQRSWIFSAREVLIIDKLKGSYQRAAARFYFHPDVWMQQTQDNRFESKLFGEHPLCISVEGAMHAYLEDTLWHPRFGQSIKNQCLVVQLGKNELRTAFSF